MKELQNIFVISYSKRCMQNLIWEDNAVLIITEFLTNVLNVLSYENIDQWLIQNDSSSDSVS